MPKYFIMYSFKDLSFEIYILYLHKRNSHEKLFYYVLFIIEQSAKYNVVFKVIFFFIFTIQLLFNNRMCHVEFAST